MAWGMFLAIPCPRKIWSESARQKMLVCMPLVGLLAGGVWAGVWLLLQGAPGPVRAAVCAAAPWLVTGFMHLDGYMDVCDAVLSRRDLATRQRILKDSHCGAFAVICMVLLAMGQWSLFLAAEDVSWLGLLLIIVFSLKLGWFPSGGYEDGILSIVLPAFTIGAGLAAFMTRSTRSSMLDVIRQDYLRMARAKGVPERKVIRKHALRNALIPIITVFGVQFSNVLGGSVLAETVFAWPGVGRLVVDAIDQRDIPTVTGALVMTTMLVTVVNLLIDIVYAYVDPRIKSQYMK